LTSSFSRIDPHKDLGAALLTIDKPGRYTGGEFGSLAKKKEETRELIRLKSVIAFPDLYEIGMGNQALRIIYNRMNAINGVLCDRAFAPAPDFEKLLREKNIPLYGLDTGISLCNTDLLMFTIGYELGLNGILTMLDICGIPLHCDERNKNEKDEFPVIIAGGPAVSNPLPYSPFIDAFWIGEAEAGFFDLAARLAKLKEEGKGRAKLLEEISQHHSVWVKDGKKAKRAVDFDFAFKKNPAPVFPIPSMKIIQHHGAVEIMRGCPNGCRFCHAGFWYRPARQKDIKTIKDEVNEFVTKGGWQEISLSSLSSGDYDGVDELIDNLNKVFSKKHVSFQLPSLKVSSFSLSILNKISLTRKSGLTFAVETPREAWQFAINKEVSRDSVVSIIEEARKSGWKGAKFYFMIGLVTLNNNNEEEEIIEFIMDVGRRTRTHFNINVGIFIPKPHTPFQSSMQMESREAERKLSFIRSKLKPLGHKVSVSDSLISKIEGLLSRGDERAGLFCEEAWKGGSRLDPWSEFINRDIWQSILERNSNHVDAIFSGTITPFPWEEIDSCVTKEYVNQENKKSDSFTRTASCKEKCGFCGVCSKEYLAANKACASPLKQDENNNPHEEKSPHNVNHDNDKVNNKDKPCDPAVFRVIFSFSKEGSAVFHGHLSLIEIFSMSLRRAGISVIYTQGYNPLAKMEFASPLSTGITALNEYASVDFPSEINTDSFIKNLNNSLPDGIIINTAECFCIKGGQKKHSLSSLLWGFSYEGANGTDFIESKQEKAYRQSRLENDLSSLFYLKRKETLARNICGTDDKWASYFDVFRFLYG